MLPFLLHPISQFKNFHHRNLKGYLWPFFIYIALGAILGSIHKSQALQGNTGLPYPFVFTYYRILIPALHVLMLSSLFKITGKMHDKNVSFHDMLKLSFVLYWLYVMWAMLLLLTPVFEHRDIVYTSLLTFVVASYVALYFYCTMEIKGMLRCALLSIACIAVARLGVFMLSSLGKSAMGLQ